MVMPTHGSAVGALLNNERLTLDKRLKIAQMVMQARADYTRPLFPDRPAALQLDDHELIDAYQIWESGSTPGKDKQRNLKLFGAWRCAVRQAEAAAGMSLLCLVSAAHTFEDHHLGDEADILLTIAEEEFPGFRRKDCPVLPWDELREWCLVKGRDHNVLPRYLRSMEHPRSGVPFHKPYGQRGGERFPPDEPLEEQKSLWDE